MRVLLIDNEQDVLLLLRLSFQFAGILDVVALDDARRVAEWDLAQFDIVLTDWMMPHGGGMGVVKWVRENDPDLPVVILTHANESDVQESLQEAGFGDVEVLPKRNIGMDPDEIRTIVGLRARTVGRP